MENISKKSGRVLQLMSCSVLTTFIVAGAAQAQSATANSAASVSASRAVTVSISQKPLAEALADFSRATNLQIVMDPARIAGLNSTAVSGTFTPNQALQRMLRGTGVKFQLRGTRVIIKPGQVAPVSPRAVTPPVQRTQVQPTQSRPRLPASTAVSTYPTPTAAQNERQDAEVVIVRGTPQRDSAAAAQRSKRVAVTIRDVISADSIGNFPDKSSAEALSRLPGVAVERDQGQSRFVNVRGAPRNFAQVSFDGVSIPGFDYETGLGGGNDRTARFDLLPTEYANSIEVIKAVTPDVPADAIAGRVNVVTRGALDRPGFHASLRLGAGLNLQGTRSINDIGFTISNTFFDDKLGILFTGSRFDEEKFTDNYEARFAFGKGEWWRASERFRVYNLTRTNDSLSTRIDLRLNDNHRFFVRSIWTQFEDDEQNDNINFVFNAAGVLGYQGNNGFTANTPTKGELVNLTFIISGLERIYYQRLSSTTIGGKSSFGDLDVDYNVTVNDVIDDQDRRSSFGQNYDNANLVNRPTLVYDYTDPKRPSYQIFNTAQNGASRVRGEGAYSGWVQANEVPNTGGNTFIDREPSKQTTAQLDFDYKGLNIFGQSIAPSFGIKAEEMTRSRTRLNRFYDQKTLAASGQTALKGSQYLTDRLANNSFSPFPWLIYSDDLWVQSFLALEGKGGAVASPAGPENGERYRFKENNLAAYVMGTWKPEWGTVVAGIRSESTEVQSQANTSFGLGTLVLRQVERSYSRLFPSVHVNWNVNEQWVARASFSTALARPSVSVSIPENNFLDPGLLLIGADGTPIVRQLQGEVFKPENGSVNGGNPYLEPTYSKGLDFSAERYGAGIGLFSVAAYYKWLDDPIYGSRQIISDTSFDVNLPLIRTVNAQGVTISETKLATRQGYIYSSQFNGSNGTLYGIELNYMKQFDAWPGWLSGFGVEANMTFSKSEAKVPVSPFPTAFPSRSVPLQGASDRVMNLTVFYEKYGLSGRLSYQYRSGYLDSLDLGRTDNDIYWDENGRFDMAIRYEMTPKSSIYLDIRNLTDTEGYRYIGDYSRGYEVETFGRQVLAGVKLTF
jgi:TonB-dependent receptor